MIEVFVLTRDALSRCESKTCPSELITPPDDCHVNRSLSFTLQVSIIQTFFPMDTFFYTNPEIPISVLILSLVYQCYFSKSHIATSMYLCFCAHIAYRWYIVMSMLTMMLPSSQCVVPPLLNA